MKDDSQKDWSDNPNNWLYGRIKCPRIVYTERTSKWLAKYLNETEKSYDYRPICEKFGVPCMRAEIDYDCSKTCSLLNAEKTKQKLGREEEDF